MKSNIQLIFIMILGVLMVSACNNNTDMVQSSMLESTAPSLPDTTLGNERIIIKTAEIRLIRRSCLSL